MCQKRNVMANEIVGFDGFNVFFALVIFSELIIKFVIRFARFVRILCENFRKAMGMVARNHQCCMYD